jgi:hypothetical protein
MIGRMFILARPLPNFRTATGLYDHKIQKWELAKPYVSPLYNNRIGINYTIFRGGFIYAIDIG